MSKKLPLEIRRNYTIKDQGNTWHLKCDVCGDSWSLAKPEKGKEVHGGNVLHLLDHAASHPLPKEEEGTALVVASEPTVELAPESTPEPEPPTSKVMILSTTKYAHSTEKTPNPYRVVVNGQTTTVAHFRDPSYTKFRQVEKSGEGYSIVLYAANPRHAALVGQRLIEKHLHKE